MSEPMNQPREFLDGKVTLYGGDNRDVLKLLPDNSIDSIVTDPPYALVSIQKRFGKPGSAPAVHGKDGLYARASAGFMGKSWDTGEVAFSDVFWAECLRVLKPGGHVVAFSGTRTYHRMAVAIEDAGFEIRDQLGWLYGSGFPKSHDVSKAIDKAAGAEREVLRERYTVKRLKPGATVEREGEWGKQEIPYTATDSAPATDAAREWQGWGTALKPSWEPICLGRKPLAVPLDDVLDADAPVRMRSATVAENVLKHGTGAINVDGCRIEAPGEHIANHGETGNSEPTSYSLGSRTAMQTAGQALGRWPANIVHDGSDEVLAAFPDTASGAMKAGTQRAAQDVPGSVVYGVYGGNVSARDIPASQGSAARFFYQAKADKLDRIGSRHPTVKPVDLMQWLCRLVTPPGGGVLDPFAGSGSTGEAAWREGFRCILVEREEEYQADIAARLELADKGPLERKKRAIKQADGAGPLFGDNDNNANGGGQGHLRQVRGPAARIQEAG